jgi:hypothetical protein
MTNLSPAAQHFYDSFWGEGYFEAEELPSRLAAALRAVAMQSTFADVAVNKTIEVVSVDTLLAIANELEAQ